MVRPSEIQEFGAPATWREFHSWTSKLEPRKGATIRLFIVINYSLFPHDSWPYAYQHANLTRLLWGRTLVRRLLRFVGSLGWKEPWRVNGQVLFLVVLKVLFHDSGLPIQIDAGIRNP